MVNGVCFLSVVEKLATRHHHFDSLTLKESSITEIQPWPQTSHKHFREPKWPITFHHIAINGKINARVGSRSHFGCEKKENLSLILMVPLMAFFLEKKDPQKNSNIFQQLIKIKRIFKCNPILAV